MKKLMRREDDYSSRREHLKDLTEEQLKERFWSLLGDIMDPMIDMAKTHTTPSIERSVLLRMGISSLDTQAVVNGCIERNLLGKGAGHVVYKYAQMKKINVQEAGVALAKGEGWEDIEKAFEGSAK